MEKAILRNMLFEKYFEVDDGILATDLVDKLSFIPQLWNKLHVLCESNIQYFDSLSTLEKIKIIEHKNRNYLILKLRMFNYVIIDIEKMENITEKQFVAEFDEVFFTDHFNEVKFDDHRKLFALYHVNNFNGDIKELLDFYLENQEVLCLSTKLRYHLEIDQAWTYFYIDFANAAAQMGFQTKDQFLYEQLFLRYDLSPSNAQDAQDRIGRDDMQKMFERIMSLKIPKEVIPEDLYQQFLIQTNTEIKHVKVKTTFN